MSNDLITETINCLRATFKVTDNEIRKQAEARLKELGKLLIILGNDQMNHFKILLELIKDQDQVESNKLLILDDIKLSIAVYMKKLVKDKLTDKTLSAEQALEILKHIIDLVLLNKVSDVCLNNLNLLIKDILDYKLIADNSKVIPNLEYIVNEILINIYHYLEKLTTATPYKVIASLLEKIVESSSVGHTNALDVMNKVMTSVEFMFLKMVEGLKAIDIKTDLTNYLLCIDICKQLFVLLHSSVIKLRSRLNMMSKLYEPLAMKFIPFAINFAMMTVPEVMPVYFIAWQGNNAFDTSVNSMKAKAFLFINSILQSKKEKIIENVLLPLYTELVQSSVTNLEYVVAEKFEYIQNMGKDHLIPDYNYETLIYQVILFLSRVLIREPFINQFGQIAYK